MSGSPGSGGSDGGFAAALTELKERGTNVLVVGGGAGELHASACRRLLGDAERERRRRVVVDVSNGGKRAHPLLGTGEGAIDPATVGRIGFSVETRSVRETTSTEAEPALADGPEDVTIDASEGLTALGLAVEDAIADFEATTARDSEPGEIRLCVHTLAPLLDQFGTEAAFRLLHVLTRRVRDCSGMGHYHLFARRESTVATTLEPLFEVVVEIRDHGGQAQQRWHLQESGLASAWLPLE